MPKGQKLPHEYQLRIEQNKRKQEVNILPGHPELGIKTKLIQKTIVDDKKTHQPQQAENIPRIELIEGGQKENEAHDGHKREGAQHPAPKQVTLLNDRFIVGRPNKFEGKYLGTPVFDNPQISRYDLPGGNGEWKPEVTIVPNSLGSPCFPANNG